MMWRVYDIRQLQRPSFDRVPFVPALSPRRIDVHPLQANSVFGFHAQGWNEFLMRLGRLRLQLGANGHAWQIRLLSKSAKTP